MTAEILSTGDEVLLGDLVDTNSAFLCDRLKQMGIRVSRITARGDDVDAVCETVLDISRRARICLATGGLGPTQDDITAQACAKAAGESLVLNARAFESMKTYFSRRGFDLTPDNEKQAWLPASADVLENDHGTDPGFVFFLNQCWFFCMPGVPSEMKQMMETRVVPKLTAIFGSGYRLHIRRYTVFGLHESRVGGLLKSFNDHFPDIRLGFRASFPIIEVKLVCEKKTGEDNPYKVHACGETAGAGITDAMAVDRVEKDSRRGMERAGKWVAEKLGSKVVSMTGLSLEEEVGRLLTQRGQTLAVAESCTGGLISHLITQVPGSSDYFLLSAVTYANTAKVKVLGVNPQTLETCGAVHETTALEMAKGARQVSGSDWAVSTTGIAGPGGGPTSKKVGTVCIGLAGPGGLEKARTFEFRFDDRNKNKKMFAAMALETLRRHLVA
ncbi:MAG TPA: nicotinamide-nucleotide amidohydrolase family protein [Desulfotignum sp.]|nr:nicotinamide-nucleotide amidohydrolase family protein [Desulfotignum sp.]